MFDCEPVIKVALLQNCPKAEIVLAGDFLIPHGINTAKPLGIRCLHGKIVLTDAFGNKPAEEKEIILLASKNAVFTLDVEIGIDFHWQRTKKLTYRGNIILRAAADSSFHLINEIALEDYLTSVISSEMSSTAPLEFLKAQAVTARSWLAAMLERKKRKAPATAADAAEGKEIIRWYDTNDHIGFDVCADDHCQRYQGIARINERVQEAVAATRGVYLVYADEICDARYHKACGGRTDIFASAWEEKSHPYLPSISDSANDYPPVRSEDDAEKWFTSRPAACCNTEDKTLLSEILPSFDQETPDFYRWQVEYKREDLEKIIRDKSGIDFGMLINLAPVSRGPSGRISRLKVEGTKKTVTVGKELEIRRWLSPSHLLSSAFIVVAPQSPDGSIERFIFKGGGWGHGVGLCQIGAAVMAKQGFSCEKILAHYFPGAGLQKLYN